jgi:hypothetical protein
MTTDLHDRLADLAGVAPTPHVSAADLWARGGRYRRRRRAVSAVVAAACVVLVALSVGTAIRAAAPVEVQPADTDGRTVLPHRFFSPSPWLPGTAGTGPVGPLIAVIPAERKTWTETEDGIVGVSAITQQYAFLDLPDALAGLGVALSPDGRRVGYWLTGPVEGHPNTMQLGGSAVGYAVFDTVTGEVLWRERFETAHGLAPDEMVWADDNTLVLEFGHWAGGDGDDIDSGTVLDSQLRAYDLGGPRSRVLTVNDWTWSVVGSNGAGVVVLDAADGSFVLLDPARPGDARVRGTDLQITHVPVPSPDGRRVAAIWGGADPGEISNMDRPVVVGAVTDQKVVDLHKVPDYLGTSQVESWLDDRHVLLTETRAGRDYQPWLVSVDVVTGQTESYGPAVPDLQLALDLTDSRVVDAAAPPHPTDPRILWGLALGGIVLVIGLLRWFVLWRRRGRA